MQPDLLGDRQNIRQYRLFFGSIIGALSGLVIGLFLVLISDQFNQSINSLFEAVILSLILGAINGVLSEENFIHPTANIDLSLKNFQSALKQALIHGLIGGLISGLTLGLILALLVGLAVGIISGIFWGLLFGLTIGLIANTMIGMRSAQLQKKTQPNEGILKAAQNALILGSASLPVNFLLGSFLIWLLFPLGVQNPSFDLFDTLFLATALAIFLGLYSGGGYVLIQHICLRYLLMKNQVIPNNYGDFLIYCSEKLNLLKHSDGRFRFYHDLLRERIAHMYPRHSIVEIPAQSPWKKWSSHISYIAFLVFALVGSSRVIFPNNYFFLEQQDLLLQDPIFYKFQPKNRHDLVLAQIQFRHYIAQIIGLPGETIAVKQGKLLVNDVAYGDRYSALKFAKDLQPKRLPGDRYLAIRQIDNRVDYILLAPEDIQAKMLFRIYPLDRFGPIEP